MTNSKSASSKSSEETFDKAAKVDTGKEETATLLTAFCDTFIITSEDIDHLADVIQDAKEEVVEAKQPTVEENKDVVLAQPEADEEQPLVKQPSVEETESTKNNVNQEEVKASQPKEQEANNPP